MSEAILAILLALALAAWAVTGLEWVAFLVALLFAALLVALALGYARQRRQDRDDYDWDV